MPIASRFRILLADDEPRVLEEYEQILGGADVEGGDRQLLNELEADLFGDDSSDLPVESFDLTLCRQSHEVIAAVEQSLREDRPFAVAFIDFRMPPGADGAVTAERIRKLDHRINIVFVTAYSDIGLADIVARVPPPDKLLYCNKPLHASELRHFAHALSAKWSTERFLQATQERLEQIVNSTPVIVYCREAMPDYRATFVSRNVQQQFGYDERAFLEEATPWFGRVHREDLSRVHQAIEGLPTEGEMAAEYRFQLKDGSYRWVSDRVKLLRDALGQPKQLIGCLIDITERRRSEDRIRHLAYFDGLTGLPNRVLMRDLLDHALASAARHKRSLAVLFLDLDQFKRINDTLGHDVGDKLLRAVSKRLLSCIRRSDSLFQEWMKSGGGNLAGSETISRLGGDEFVIILSEIKDASDAANVADRIAGALNSPIAVDNDEISISASIGISVYPDDAEDVESLLKHADTAMYHAKEEGRNCYAFFSGAINERATRRFTIEANLRKAMERGELSLFYQPRIDLRAKRVIGMEALLRWRSPDGHWIAPAEFVPVAEETGLILAIGEWVFDEACRQNAAWSKAGLPMLTVSINLSPVQFKKKGFVKQISDTLSKYGLEPGLLEVEFTESLLIDDTPRSRNIVSDLQGIGVKISIDDFGTGYSSLSYLKNFTFNALKLDQSLIQDVCHSSNDAAIVQATVGLAHNLGLRVVAEGVEEQVQLDFLVQNECDEAQGYFFAPPLDDQAFAQWCQDYCFASRKDNIVSTKADVKKGRAA
jgi:diguanylate cyclase (GGDEF)-like protein/PAS domain S-box-containing protein